MRSKNNDDFQSLLNSISSVMSYKILKLYQKNNKGYILTETAEKIEESVSTTQDRLKKLLTSNLIVKKNKLYYISNFGNYIITELHKFETFNEVSNIFGKLTKDAIPPHILDKLIPHLSDVNHQRSSLHLMSSFNDLMNKLKGDINYSKNEFKVLGWWSVAMDMEFFVTFIGEFTPKQESFQQLIKNMSFKFISHEGIYSAFKNDEKLIKFMEDFNILESVRINKSMNDFNFSVMMYDNIFLLFLIEENDIDPKNYLFLKDNEGAKNFFNELFNYYWEQSIPFNEYENTK